MKEIFFADLKKAVFSIKSLFIIIFFSLIAHLIAQNYGTVARGVQGTVVTTVYNTIETFGVLFGFMLFSGTISKMIENESIRFVTPYLSRFQILLSKYIAILCYFLLLLLFMLPIIMISTQTFVFPFKEFCQAFLFFAYISSIILWISVISRNERKSTFIGISVGILIPVVGAVSLFSKNIAITVLSWLLPYRYEVLNFESLILVILTGVVMLTAILLFQKMEL